MGLNLKQVIINLIFPPRCAFCQSPLSPKAKIFVCADCANELPYTRKYSRCKHCGRPISNTKTNICNRCRTKRSCITRQTAAFVYADKAKQAVIAFKKRYNIANANVLSLYIAEMLKYDFTGIEFDYIISVPPRIKGLKDDNYDQAESLAEAVALKISVPYLKDALIQTKKIRKQSTLNYSERIKNVQGNIAVKKSNHIKDKTILLIDDVCTSGATLEECAKVLKENGAFRIYAATLTTVPGM